MPDVVVSFTCGGKGEGMEIISPSVETLQKTETGNSGCTDRAE